MAFQRKKKVSTDNIASSRKIRTLVLLEIVFPLTENWTGTDFEDDIDVRHERMVMTLINLKE